jgi:predicted SprT family Zn-dependent metalloprotease
VSINIKATLMSDTVDLTATLLHELAHYYCWYLGYQHHDDDRDFLRLCEKMHLPTHYTYRWDGHKWIDSYDYGYARNYMEMYERRKCA